MDLFDWSLRPICISGDSDEIASKDDVEEEEKMMPDFTHAIIKDVEHNCCGESPTQIDGQGH
jgi:hypothetical protein